VTEMSPISDYLKPAAFVLLPHVGGIGGAIITRSQIPVWYSNLVRAPWNPPKWVFGPVWTSLYTGMGYASWLVYKEAGLKSTPMYLYGAQLALNWAWTPMFFGAHKVGLACLDLLATLGLVVACAKEFSSVNQTAGRLMLPYIGWLCLAATLNIYIWLYNDSRTLSGEGASQQAKSKK
ncbi:hypothetical protein BOX15_Mlig016537g3, partial [Macrostomum lignano]